MCIPAYQPLCWYAYKHLSYIAIHNWTVNMEGKPLDQMMEHYNLYVTNRYTYAQFIFLILLVW